ncbi:hypothetical protein AOQ84DRAFT_407192 [Glonium stellatum]|uniref:Aminoglycoside phosphotransferase domain-containing protein n=1 Tax=Glonium stellatum TaxID=574774 RepID=A0A8E2F108_9PEZI|nr:hypothetical protein AOQ84DRAFT_407192 [Glonium stellatum]
MDTASSHWIGVLAYQEHDALHQRATTFLQQVGWEAVTRICSQKHQNIPCRLQNNFAVGRFNLVRHLIFEDGIEWAVRLRLPELPSDSDTAKVQDVELMMRCEIASMKYLKQKTSILVPEIHHYDLNPNNEVGARFVVVDYINGTTAYRLLMRKQRPLFTFGTEEQSAKLKQQMAQIQVELARCQFGQIGSLRHDEDSSEFTIGPDVETGLGPWKSSFAYYHDVVERSLKSCASKKELNNRQSFAAPILFKDLVHRYCSDDTGPFSLANRDFGFHNILVDDNFSIVGVIDFAGIMAAPKEIVGQFPAMSGMNPPAPGIPPRNDFVKAREEEERPLIEAYVALLRTLAVGPEAQIFANMMAIPNSLVQGMTDLACHQDFVIEQWMDSFVYLLRESVLKGSQTIPTGNELAS